MGDRHGAQCRKVDAKRAEVVERFARQELAAYLVMGRGVLFDEADRAVCASQADRQCRSSQAAAEDQCFRFSCRRHIFYARPPVRLASRLTVTIRTVPCLSQPLDAEPGR